MSNIDTIIQHIATHTTNSAAIAAERGRKQRGWIVELGHLGQRAMGVEYPSPVTPAQRQHIAAELTGRGFTVQTNTERRGNAQTERFFSFTVTL